MSIVIEIDGSCLSQGNTFYHFFLPGVVSKECHCGFRQMLAFYCALQYLFCGKHIFLCNT